eukprot:Ihof_evm13s11 gene=Ihof_evmTU13s11
MVFVGIDLGGTNAKAGVVSESGNLLKRQEKHLVDLSAEAVVADLVLCAETALTALDLTWKDVKAIGVGSPGGISDGHVTVAANFPLWHMVPLAHMISDATQ